MSVAESGKRHNDELHGSLNIVQILLEMEGGIGVDLEVGDNLSYDVLDLGFERTLEKEIL